MAEKDQIEKLRKWGIIAFVVVIVFSVKDCWETTSPGPSVLEMNESEARLIYERHNNTR